MAGMIALMLTTLVVSVAGHNHCTVGAPPLNYALHTTIPNPTMCATTTTTAVATTTTTAAFDPNSTTTVTTTPVTTTTTTPVTTTTTTPVTTTTTTQPTTTSTTTTIPTTTSTSTTTTTMACVVVGCAAPAYATTACTPAAGAESTCNVKSSEAAINACMPSTFKAKCPTGNVYPTLAAELNEAVLKCKACSWTSTIVDMDPRPSRAVVEVSWGDLMDNNGNYVSGITEYEVRMSASGIRPMSMGSKVGSAIPRSSGVNCCNPKKYSVTIDTGLPSTYDNGGKVFLIAKTTNGALPPVAVTMPFTDKKAGQAKTYTSSFDVTMTTGDITTLMAKPEASNSIAKAISATLGLAESEGITIVKKIYQGNPPTTQVFPPTGGRRLQDSKLRVEFEVLVTAAGKTLSSTALTSTAGQNNLMTSIEAQAALIGANIDAKGVVAQSLGNPTTIGTPTTGTTSAAFGRMVSLLGLITAIGAPMMLSM